jgi:Ca2+-binding RTX toxin-like protein
MAGLGCQKRGVKIARVMKSEGGSAANINLAWGVASTAYRNDTLFSIEGAIGSKYDDIIYGQNVVGDQILGGNGNDVIYGFGGDDIINGGEGRDQINGGSGSNYLTGGMGADLFECSDGSSINLISDFVVGEDRLQFVLSTSMMSSLEVSVQPDGVFVGLMATGCGFTLLGNFSPVALSQYLA